MIIEKVARQHIGHIIRNYMLIKIMTINKIEVKTCYHVEINFHEFWEQLQALMQDVANGNDYFIRNVRQLKEVKSLIKDNLSEEGCTLHFAKHQFKNFDSLLRDEVIHYIAMSSGYSCTFYGGYYRHTNTIRATFERDGAHLGE